MDPTPQSEIAIEGSLNIVLLGCVVGLVLMSGLWKPGIVFTLFDTAIALQDLLRDVLLICVVAGSLAITPKFIHAGNGFSWGPVQEVAKLFAGIFITLAPLIAMLRAGGAGPFAGAAAVLTDAAGQPVNMAYFWASGLLSSVLDNAPTYLVFFNIAGGDPLALMGRLGATLTAISCGSVFMGALSYIGNGPNMMVKAIAEDRGIRMPSFFGYMGWSCGILLPLFALMALLFFR